jgi:aspartate carbamoyltransferase catalytic subunit
MTATSNAAIDRPDAPRFGHRHLLGIEGLQPHDISALLDLSEKAIDVSRQVEKKLSTLRGRTQINLFFEASTRTQSSFELAGKAPRRRCHEHVRCLFFGEERRDVDRYGNDAERHAARHYLIIRHHAAGAVQLLARKVGCSVINAGDGAHEHPTQALLDALTIRRHKGSSQGLTVAICGDILHSRVARSNIILLLHDGRACPAMWAVNAYARPKSDDLDAMCTPPWPKALDGADVVMMLRLQRERMHAGLMPSTREYFRHYGLDAAKLRFAKPDALVMHPGR